MGFYGDVDTGDILIAYHKDTGTVLTGTVLKPATFQPGLSSFLPLTGVKGAAFPVEEVTLNVNLWDVYTLTDPGANKILMEAYFKEER